MIWLIMWFIGIFITAYIFKRIERSGILLFYNDSNLQFYILCIIWPCVLLIWLIALFIICVKNTMEEIS